LATAEEIDPDTILRIEIEVFEFFYDEVKIMSKNDLWKDTVRRTK